MTHPIAAAHKDGEDAAIAFGRNLGRKFEAQDVADNPWLRGVATHFAIDANEDFGFMGDMLVAAQGRWGLSNAQAKGVLNTLMARANRAATPNGTAPALPNVKDVPSARYRVVQEDGSSVAIRLDSAAWAKDKPKGTRCIAIRTAEGWNNLGFVDPEGTVALWRRALPFSARLTPALTTVANGVTDGTWLIYALSYAQEGGECAFCGKDLDTQESLTVGYGPQCAKKHGLPWGAKAVPMTVALAQAGQGAAPTPQPTPAPKRTYDEVFGDDDGWGERKEFIDNTTNDAPAPTSSLLDLARKLTASEPNEYAF